MSPLHANSLITRRVFYLTHSEVVCYKRCNYYAAGKRSTKVVIDPTLYDLNRVETNQPLTVGVDLAYRFR